MLKTAHEGTARAKFEEFINEIKIMRDISHPNVLKLHGIIRFGVTLESVSLLLLLLFCIICPSSFQIPIQPLPACHYQCWGWLLKNLIFVAASLSHCWWCLTGARTATSTNCCAGPISMYVRTYRLHEFCNLNKELCKMLVNCCLQNDCLHRYDIQLRFGHRRASCVH